MRHAMRLMIALLAIAAADEEAPAAEPEVAEPEVAVPDVTIESPSTVDGAVFFEPFHSSWESTWKVSKDADFNGRWKLETYINGGDDTGLVVGDMARKHAVSTLFPTAFDPKDKGL